MYLRDYKKFLACSRAIEGILETPEIKKLKASSRGKEKVERLEEANSEIKIAMMDFRYKRHSSGRCVYVLKENETICEFCNG